MKRILSIFSRPTIFAAIFFVLILNTNVTKASDLEPHEILVQQTLVNYLIAYQMALTICNINIYDALANEWTVDVRIKDSNENEVFQETVQGVFLGSGSSANPTCTTVETVNSFIPEMEGVYTVVVDVNYIYDIDPSNDTMTEEFIVEFALGSISGQKFEDFNDNSKKDSTEVGIDGVTIELYDSNGGLIKQQKTYSEDLNNDTMIDPRTESGLFLFDSLQAGNYTVSENVPGGWTQTYPPNDGKYSIELESGGIVDSLLFGNTADEDYDFGDLPDPFDPDDPCLFGQCYPTLLPLGARHPAVGPMLGDLRDTEDDGQPSFTADGDDLVWLFGVDDEDGIEFVKYSIDDSSEVKVKVTGTVPDDFPAYLSGWIDFNGDRLMTSGFIGPNEQIVAAKVTAPGTYTYKFKVPDGTNEGIYSRFRISKSALSVVFSFGVALDGEVEDMAVLGVDLGDANEEGDSSIAFPHGYPVKVTSNGARHIISPLKRLGEEDTDHDMMGKPSYYANGDDNDNHEDENGILYGDEFFISYDGPDPDNPSRHMTIYGMIPGSTVKITPLATQSGLFNAWIDWNRDGDWADEGEQIFDDEVIVSGPNYTTLSFNIPNDADLGYTYARYRFSTQPGLEFTGGAFDGEVEDHILMMGPDPTGIEDGQSNLPKEFMLYQNYPNPFNPSTSIEFAIPHRSNVTVKVYNTLGQIVGILFNDTVEPGIHKVDWNAENMTSGVYFYRIEATAKEGNDEFTKVGKMILLR